MSRNRVIGQGGRIPWHLPEDFRWFKQTTMGHILVMGRKTFESIGRPLPGRTTIVLSRTMNNQPGVTVVRSLDEVETREDGRKLFLCGGAEVYAQALDRCCELCLTVVDREVSGDSFFPEFEGRFDFVERLLETPAFTISRYRHR